MYLLLDYITQLYEDFSFSSYVLEPLYWKIHYDLFFNLSSLNFGSSKYDYSLISINTMSSIFFDYTTLSNFNYNLIYIISTYIFAVCSYTISELDYFFSNIFDNPVMFYSLISYYGDGLSSDQRIWKFLDEFREKHLGWDFCDSFFLEDDFYISYYMRSDEIIAYDLDFNFPYWLLKLIDADFYSSYDNFEASFEDADFLFFSDNDNKLQVLIFYSDMDLLILYHLDYNDFNIILNSLDYEVFITPYTPGVEWYSIDDSFFLIYYYNQNRWYTLDLCEFVRSPTMIIPEYEYPIKTNYNWMFSRRVFKESLLPIIGHSVGYYKILNFHTTMIRYLEHFMHPIFFEIYCQVYQHNQDLLFFKQTPIYYTNSISFVESIFLNTVLSMFIFCYFLIVVLFIINLKIFKHRTMFVILNNKISKIFEYDFGPNSEIKFFFLMIFFYFFVFFFKTYINVMGITSWSTFVWYYILFLIFICFFYPVILVYTFGIYFLNYIKGSNRKQSLFKNFFFDSMSLISYFSRFFLQLIRVILIFLVYFVLHEFFIDEFLGSTYCNYYSYISETNYFLYLILMIMRLIYELLDFLMILLLQLIAFFAVMFILFSFLFTTNSNIKYEHYISNKNHKKS